MSFLPLLKNVTALNKHSENFCKLKPGTLHILIKVEKNIQMQTKYVHIFPMHTFKLQKMKTWEK